jgi:hypothetical protein
MPVSGIPMPLDIGQFEQNLPAQLVIRQVALLHPGLDRALAHPKVFRESLPRQQWFDRFVCNLLLFNLCDGSNLSLVNRVHRG